MHKPSSSALVLAALWLIYGVVTTYVLYDAMEPLKRELLGILGGFAVVLVVGTGMLFLPGRRMNPVDKTPEDI